MAAENASNNVTTGNGNVPKNAEQPPPPPQQKTDSFLYTLMMTIYDVIIFLGISIGYILQVSITIKFKISKEKEKINTSDDNDHHIFYHR